MDNQQQDRFKEAVDRKARDAEAASRETEPGEVQGDQESLHSPSQPQDTLNVRDKNSRHKKVTADKWNQ
jgi:hypothetical protein